MLVRDIMARSARTVSPETPLVEVVSLMCLYRFSGLPVLDGDRLVGIIAEKDVLARLFPTLEELMEGGMGNVDLDEMMDRYKEVVRLKVSDVMTPRPITVAPDMHVLRAAAVMAKHKFRRIPVAEGDDHLVGMLSLGDVHKAIFQETIARNLTVA
jgi:CBS domain-containing protein